MNVEQMNIYALLASINRHLGRPKTAVRKYRGEPRFHKGHISTEWHGAELHLIECTSPDRAVNVVAKTTTRADMLVVLNALCFGILAGQAALLKKQKWSNR